MFNDIELDFRLQILRALSAIATSKKEISVTSSGFRKKIKKNVFDTQNPSPFPSSSNRTHERHNTWTSWKIFNLKVTK